MDIESIKRKLLIKYPTFGSTITRLEFEENKNIKTAKTNGKKVLYNPQFIESLSDKQQIFVFAHEVCHVVFDHIYRCEGKDKEVWNIATDSVINALLEQEGLQIVDGGVNIPEAVNYNAEEMYEKLIKENKDARTQKQKEHVENDSHSLWEKAIEEMKKEQENAQSNQEGTSKDQGNDKKGKQSLSSSQKRKNDLNKDKKNKIDEKEAFKQNKIERNKRLQELSKELANKSSQSTGDGIPREGRMIYDIGIARPLIDWRKLLRQAIKYKEEYTRKNARMRNGYFRHKIEQIAEPETEIVLDVSGSVSENLLKNFLRECKNIINNSKVKVGCFNTKFHGFTEIKRVEDIDKMKFTIGGGTDFDVAVNAFSRRAANKIIFTDGEAKMPKETVRNVIWIVFGETRINPRGGKVINITGEQLDRLYKNSAKANVR